MSMERGGFGSVVRAEVLRVAQSLLERARSLLAARQIAGRALCALARRLRVCERRGPARVGAEVVRDGGRTFRREVPQEAPSPAARARRQGLVNSA